MEDMERFAQEEISIGVRVFLYLVEIIAIALFITIPHELLGHACPLWFFGYGVEEIGFMPPFGAYVKPATAIATIVTPHLYAIAFGGVFVDILLGFSLYQGFLYYDPKKHPERKVVVTWGGTEYDATPLVRGAFLSASGLLAGSVILNALPLMQFSIHWGGISLLPVVGNDGSTFIFLTLTRALETGVVGEWVAFGVGVATITLLIYGAARIILGIVPTIFPEGEAKETGRVMGSRIWYRPRLSLINPEPQEPHPPPPSQKRPESPARPQQPGQSPAQTQPVVPPPGRGRGKTRRERRRKHKKVKGEKK